MALTTLLYFYGRRLAARPAQELLAGLGVAIGVALTYAVLMANGNAVDSAANITQRVVGPATLQLASRDDRGFDERILRRVSALPGVVRAAPLLEQRAVLVGPRGATMSVGLAGTTSEVLNASGSLPGGMRPADLARYDGLVLSTDTARALDVPLPVSAASMPAIGRVRVRVHGRQSVQYASFVPDRLVGSLASTRAGLVPLSRLQRMVGAPGRLTRILVVTEAGRGDTVRAALERLAAGRLTVSATDVDVTLLAQATKASNQATFFFAVVSVVLGLMLAAGAMLLTAPDRRRVVAELRMLGFGRLQVAKLVMFQAVILGGVASAIGLYCGNLVARSLFSDSTGYLSQSFTVGTALSPATSSIVIALLVGIVACVAAAAPALSDLRTSRAVDAVFHDGGVPGQGLSSRLRVNLLVGGLVVVVVAMGLIAFAPGAALVASGLLVVGTVLVIPAVLAGVLRAGGWVAERLPGMGVAVLSLFGLRAMSLRALALAATGAVAVFGSAAIGGAREDLLRGIGHYTSDYVGTAGVWVANDGDLQATSRIDVVGVQGLLADVPGVAAVRPYYGTWLDAWGRRTWVIGRDARTAGMVPASQVVRGRGVVAERRLRAGGWIVVSDEIARAAHVEVGETFTVPSPTGDVRLRLAATTTNLGWAPGAMILNARDYRSAWADPAPSAFEVDLVPGVDPEWVQGRVRRVLGRKASLHVQTAAVRAEQIDRSAAAGLDQLEQISVLLMVAAAIALAAATGAAIWQRRTSLAALRIQSIGQRQLWAILLIESGIVLAIGCGVGVALGLVGQVGADRYLSVVTGFPVDRRLMSWNPVRTTLFVMCAALSVVAVVGWIAARVPARRGLQE